MNTATAGISVAGIDTAPRQHAADGSAKEAKKTFKDLRGTFTEEQMKIETSRCLGCGAAGNAPAAVAKLVTKKIARKQGAAIYEIGVVRSMVKTVTDFAEQNDIKEVAEIVLDIGELSLVIPKYV